MTSFGAATRAGWAERLLLPYGRLSRGSRWAVVAAWYGIIAVLSQLPGTDVESTHAALNWFDLGGLNTFARLSAHVGLFGMLAALVFGALSAESDSGAGVSGQAARTLAALGLTAALGFGDELHQHFVPKRHFRLFDVAVDTVGAAVALLVVHLYGRFSAHRATRPPMPDRS